MVGTVKMLLNKNKFLELALLAYRKGPLQCGKSPAELFMGRKFRSRIPHLEPALTSSMYNMETLVDNEVSYRNRMQRNVDNYHKVIERTVVVVGREVLIKYLGRE